MILASQLPDVVPEPDFHVPWPVKTLPHQFAGAEDIERRVIERDSPVRRRALAVLVLQSICRRHSLPEKATAGP